VQQLPEAFAEAAPYRYVILDRDSIFNADVIAFSQATGLEPKRTSIHAPSQNGTAERWTGSCRREILDQIIPINERSLSELPARDRSQRVQASRVGVADAVSPPQSDSRSANQAGGLLRPVSIPAGDLPLHNGSATCR
jgi:hypothetical protein